MWPICTRVQGWPFRIVWSVRRLTEEEHLIPFLSGHWWAAAFQPEVRSCEPCLHPCWHVELYDLMHVLRRQAHHCEFTFCLDPDLPFYYWFCFLSIFVSGFRLFLLCWIICIFLASHCSSNIYCIFYCFSLYLCEYKYSYLYILYAYAFISIHIYPYIFICVYEYASMLMCVY